MCHTVFSVAVVVIVTGGAASDNMSKFMSDLTQEITMSLVVNQLAILKGMNESSSRDRDFQLWKEEANQQMQAVEDSLRGMAEDAQSGMQAVNEAVEEVKSRLENAINILLRHVAMQAFHNDTEPSLCDERVATKVLRGGRGTLYASTFNQRCSWRVVLPAGTRPVFHWELAEKNCGGCACGWMNVYGVSDGVEEDGLGYVCHGELPYEYPVSRVTSNIFTVNIFNKRPDRGIGLHYQAVPINRDEAHNNIVSLQ